jgi:uncharacterized membrane protein YqjE
MENIHDRGKAGTVNHFLGLVSETLRYLKARTALAAEEAKLAGVQYGLAAGMVVGALVIAVLGYLFLVITAVFAIGFAFDSEHAWVTVLGLAALLHLGGAAVLVLLAKKRVGDTSFSETAAEIEKDRVWLRQLITKN